MIERQVQRERGKRATSSGFGKDITGDEVTIIVANDISRGEKATVGARGVGVLVTTSGMRTIEEKAQSSKHNLRGGEEISIGESHDESGKG